MQPHGAVRSTFFVSVICFPVLSATSNLPPFTLRQGLRYWVNCHVRQQSGSSINCPRASHPKSGVARTRKKQHHPFLCLEPKYLRRLMKLALLPYAHLGWASRPEWPDRCSRMAFRKEPGPNRDGFHGTEQAAGDQPRPAPPACPETPPQSGHSKKTSPDSRPNSPICPAREVPFPSAHMIVNFSALPAFERAGGTWLPAENLSRSSFKWLRAGARIHLLRQSNN
jgi:hypothetical protein